MRHAPPCGCAELKRAQPPGPTRANIELWPVIDPTLIEGNREVRLEDLMGVTGWNRSTAQGAISEDLVRQMGLGMLRDGDRYIGSLPEGVTSAVREPAPVKPAANRC